MTKVGFTGTRQGMTEAQMRSLTELLSHLYPTEFHHGDCVGADEQAHYIALDHSIPVVVHPPNIERYRANVEGYKEIRQPRPYLMRNRHIVDETNLLIATPGQATEQVRSGTWATVRYARPGLVYLIPPDGNWYYYREQIHD